MIQRPAVEPVRSDGDFFEGLKIYEPDVAAFRKHVQEKYLASDLAASWPEGMVDKINAL